jgi:hypothetical protein
MNDYPPKPTIMSTVTSNSWSHGEKSSLIPINDGSYSLFLSASGPPRLAPSTPAVIIEAGLCKSVHSHTPQYPARVQRFALKFMELRIDEIPGFSTLGFRDMHVAPLLSLRQQPC